MLPKSNKGRGLRMALFLRAVIPAFVGLQATIPSKQYITSNAILSTVLHPQWMSQGHPWKPWVGMNASGNQAPISKEVLQKLQAPGCCWMEGRTHVLLSTQTPHEQDTRKYFCLTSNDKKNRMGGRWRKSSSGLLIWKTVINNHQFSILHHHCLSHFPGNRINIRRYYICEQGTKVALYWSEL